MGGRIKRIFAFMASNWKNLCNPLISLPTVVDSLAHTTAMFRFTSITSLTTRQAYVTKWWSCVELCHNNCEHSREIWSYASVHCFRGGFGTFQSYMNIITIAALKASFGNVSCLRWDAMHVLKHKLCWPSQHFIQYSGIKEANEKVMSRES